MLARLQQIIVLGLLAGSVIWALIFVGLGWPAWGWAGPALLVLGYGVFMGLEFMLLAWVQEPGPELRPTARQLVLAWWGEVTTAPQVFCWHQPFRGQAQPDHLPATAPGRRGVIFVHGFVCNRGFWNPWMARLRPENVPFIALTLEPVFGSIDDYGPVIEAAVQEMESLTGCAPVVVAHSMGGLAVRAWLATFATRQRVHRVVTVGTPHHGTWLARWALTVNGREMAIGSHWLRDLASRSAPENNAAFTCFYGHCDNIVFPASTGTLVGADNRHLPATAHVHMAFHEAVYAEVWRWLSLPQASARRA